MKSQRITVVTLAVSDLEKSRKFYSDIGWEEAAGGNDIIAFYKTGGQFFALYSKAALTKDIGMPIHERSTGNVTMATNYGSREEVDMAFKNAMSAGAVEISTPAEIFWGGYSGNFADPDGHMWELAHNPFWTLDDDGFIVGEA